MSGLPAMAEVPYLVSGFFFVIVILISMTVANAALREMRGGPSDRIARREELFDQLDEQHEFVESHEKYSTSDPSFSFNGRDVVDDFAELRRRNAAHEKHLEGRVHLDL